MKDPIERQDAIDAMIEDKIQTKIYITHTAERDFEVFNDACDRHAKILKGLPSAQPEVDCKKCVFNGFPGFKQFKAEQIDPDTDLESLSSGVWDAKEVPTTQPDKIEVHLQEPHALMIKEFIGKETTYSMATKQETVGELIRCKDCKYSEHWYRDRRRCFLWSEDGVSVFDDEFCNYAERREVTT